MFTKKIHQIIFVQWDVISSLAENILKNHRYNNVIIAQGKKNRNKEVFNNDSVAHLLSINGIQYISVKQVT